MDFPQQQQPGRVSPDPEEDDDDVMMGGEPQQPQRPLGIEPSVLSTILDRINVRMLISNDERRRALAIKAAIKADDTLEPLSDMMYTQFALIDGDNVEQALTRARHLQHFREEYQINDTFEQAQEISKKFLKDHPGHMLSIAYNPMEGNYVVIYDQARLDAKKLNFHKEWQIFLAYGWYLYHALSPDLHAIRYVFCLCRTAAFLYLFFYVVPLPHLSFSRRLTSRIPPDKGSFSLPSVKGWTGKC